MDDETAAGIHGIEESVTEIHKPDGTLIVKRRSKLATDKTRNREMVLRAEGKLGEGRSDRPAGGLGFVVNVLIGPGVVPPAKQEGPQTIGGVMGADKA